MRDKTKTKEQLITEMLKLRRKLAELNRSKADYDALTGMPNRALLFDRLNQALLQASRKGQTLAVLFLFLDDLKLINDTFGHKTGDRLLKAAAGRLKECLRKSDTVARPGRNEFIVLLPEITRQEDVILVAEKILKAYDSPFMIGKQEMLINTSIGISLYPGDGLDPETLLKNSYTAMNNAKEEEKNNFMFFSDAMNSTAFNRLTIESSLRLAIKRNEFILHYQPQIDLKTERIIGIEALVRWKRPVPSGAGQRQGFVLVYPLDFISAAEDTGLIVPIGEWVLRTACQQQKLWQEAGIAPERIAVNVSARQFQQQQNIIEKVEGVLKETGLDPNSLELELTESVVFQNEGEAIATLIKLKEMGIHISIDDFGTGYSSLMYLKQFPINKLKIVQSFVRSISINSIDSAITKLIIDLSQVLKLKVIAEGVNTEEQLEFLRSAGCDEVQGHMFSKPLEAEAVAKLLANGRIPIGTTIR